MLSVTRLATIRGFPHIAGMRLADCKNILVGAMTPAVVVHSCARHLGETNDEEQNGGRRENN